MSQKNGFSFAFEASLSLAELLPLTAIGGSRDGVLPPFGGGGALGPGFPPRPGGGGGGPGGGGPAFLGGGGGGAAAGGFGGSGGEPPVLGARLKEAGRSRGKGSALPGGAFKGGIPGAGTPNLPGGGFSSDDALLLLGLTEAAVAVTLLADCIDNLTSEDTPPVVLLK